MNEDQERAVLNILAGIDESLRRLAGHFAPPITLERVKHTAVLGTATYNREERERIALRKALKGEKASTPSAGA